jgi:predicted metal-binding membrane protein
MTKNCNKEAYTAECQQALAPILHKTDLSTHTKRVLGARSVFLTIAVVALLIAWSYQLYVVANEGLPEQIKLNNADLVQIQTMTQASSFAAIGVGPGAWATATVTMQPAATSSSP